MHVMTSNVLASFSENYLRIRWYFGCSLVDIPTLPYFSMKLVDKHSQTIWQVKSYF